MKVSQLVQLCGYEYVGQDIEVNSIKYANVATKDSIAVISDEKEIEKTKANCILLAPSIVDTKKTIIYTCDSIKVTIINLAKQLMLHKVQKKKPYQKKDNYFIGENVQIGKETFISPNVFIDDDVIIGNNCYIEPNVHIGERTIIRDNVYIGSGSSIGVKSFYHYYSENKLEEFSGIGIVIIQSNVSIGNGVTIQRGSFSDTNIGENCKIGNLIDIGHDVCIGRNCKIVSQTGIASNVKIGDFAQIAGQVAIYNNVIIGNNVTIYAKSLVTKNIDDNQIISGIYARKHIEEMKSLAKIRKL